MRRVWWVRHGPTHIKEMVGWSDVPADLSDVAALARLSEFLPDAPVVSSDLIRAVATADVIQGARPRKPHDAGLREVHFGAWELQRADDLYDRDPEGMTAYWDDPATHCPPGGESFTALAARVNGALDMLLPSDGELIVVAHFGVILTQIHRARGGPLKAVLAEPVDNLSVTEVTHEHGTWRVGRINHRP